MTLDKFNKALDLQESIDCLKEFDNTLSIMNVGAHNDMENFRECQVTLSHPYGNGDRGTRIRLSLKEWEHIKDYLKENLSKELARLEDEFNKL